ncbi:MICOS complex subunit Mic60 isoform X2 [Pectinophora gossypiella]|uniref:MICOS complex subunit Mic60 isoform X2 n=1 Tax=Pectinophora gossypiella TaxID=13191 RepID=UPI00214E98BF|nr:MICOS complex subunit Mic60 isoform X2 [Pectinophora gossypiella]
MYRFSSNISKTHLVLVRKKLSDGSCAALVVMRAPVRGYAKDTFSETCPPATPPPKSRKLLYGAIGATLLTGAAVVYAKHSPETRNWLESNAPWANNFVALVYQENTTYVQFTIDQVSRMSKALTTFLFGKEGVSPMDFQQRSEQDIEKDAEIGFQPKEYSSTLVQTEKCDPHSPPKTNITKDILILEQDMHENTKIAIDNYKAALKLCTAYNKTLHRIVEFPYEDLDKKCFAKLKGLRAERDKTIATAKAASTKAKCALETLDRMIEKNNIAAPPENVTQTKRYIKLFRNDLTVAEDAVRDELTKAVISDKYWDRVEAARMAYKEELEMLFPGLDLCSRQLEFRGDVDLLLLYTMNQIQYLQNQLAENQTIREHKINKAIECRDEKAIIEAKVEDMIRKERLTKDLEFQKKTLEINAEAKKKMKEELARQFEIQEEITRTRLARKEAEIMGKFNRQVSELVEKERVIFKKELAAMAGKLKAIEQTLKQRAAAEAEARRSQSIWAAAEALLAATRRASSETKIDNELRALEKAGEGDKLVQTILKGIPPEVRDKGISTEKSLRDRFEVLEQTAMKVALIGREGASLPMYFISWLQSKLLFQKLAEIPRDELDNLPTDFSKLDTFDIIHRARYHMDNGDLPAALRYVNLLQGAARAAAACWAGAARAHLEVRQAAEAVMAHASLSGMLYL